MAATVTLTTTTLARACAATDTQVLLTSLTGVTPGACLYIDRELMKVVDPTLPGGACSVVRGYGGVGSAHPSLALVTIGRGDQFYDSDPQGLVLGGPPVQPWINVLTGSIWVPQGDESGPGVVARYWRNVTTVYGQGALGIRQSYLNPAFDGTSVSQI